jgi:hypothetical protein
VNIGTFGILEAVSDQVCGKGSIFGWRWQMLHQERREGRLALLPRQEMQNWVSFPNFLLAEHWTQLQSSDRQLQKLDTIVNHLIRLGLRHPSERTQATLAALVSHVGPNAWDASDVPDTAKQTALLSTVKAVLKGQLLRTRNMALPLPGGYIRDLPASVQELPLGMQAECFPAGAVAPPMDLNPIWQVAHGWAVRSTHRACAGGQVALVGAASSADAASIATQAAVSTVLALVPHVQRGPVDAIPGLQIFGAARREMPAQGNGARSDFGQALVRASAETASSTAGAVAPPVLDRVSTPALALEDRRPSAEAMASSTRENEQHQGKERPHVPASVAVPPTEQGHSKEPEDLELSLAALAEAHYERPLPSVEALPTGEAKTRGDRMRKPAAAAVAQGKKMRKPAAAEKTTAASCTLKRPAAAVKPKARGRAVAAKKRPAAAADTSSKTVTRSRAKRLRPEGCAKCRYQCGCTPSCWRKDGITMVAD